MELPESMVIGMNDLPEGLVPPAKNVVSLH
jgi:hypothetical protein